MGYVRPLEKRGNIHSKENGDLVQFAGGDAVRTFFVFLNLLECQAERIAEFEL
jgi:hypothetical protein